MRNKTTKEKLLAFALAATRKARAAYNRASKPVPAVKAADRRSAKTKAVEAFIRQGKFGCNTEAVAGPSALLLGEKEKVEAKAPDKEESGTPVFYPVGAIVSVVHQEDTDHSFDAGDLVIVGGSDSDGGSAGRIYKVDNPGNDAVMDLSFPKPEGVPATDAQVREFVEKLSDSEKDIAGAIGQTAFNEFKAQQG